MDMQDKEFDELFRSKLDALETEPSVNAWPAIAAGLNEGRRKSKLVPFLSIAASVVVFTTIGLLFIPKKTITKHHQQVKNSVAENVKQSVGAAPAITGQGPVHKKPVELVSVNAVAHSVSTMKHIAVKNPDSMTNKTVPVEKDEQQLAVSKQPDIIKAVVPGDATPLVIRPAAEQPMAFRDEPAQLATQLPGAGKSDTIPVKTKHKIHNLGGLLNLVVAKVDKRRNKVIEFSDNDDGGSNITSVNLGIIKIKKTE